jgi:hypothetical protein
MAKGIKVKGLTQLRRKLQSKFKLIINKTLRDKSLRLKVGKIVEQDIRDNFSESASPFTQAMREYLEQFNTTHPDYRRSKINITFTGDLLEDLASNVKADTVRLAFIVDHSNKKHKRYKQPSDVTKGKKIQVTSLRSRKTRDVRDSFAKAPQLTHKQISNHLINDLKYDYLNVTKGAESEILLLIKKTIMDNIKREFTK